MLMENRLTMRILPNTGRPYEYRMNVRRICCSRNADRNVSATESELDKLRKQGWQVHGAAAFALRSRYLLTNERGVEVQGVHTSGEVEFAAIAGKDTLYVSVASDHNDRSLTELWAPNLGKVHDTAKAKQMVPAVVAEEAWPYDDVREHWDDLVLRSSVTHRGQRVPYQEFRLAQLVDLEHYLREYPWLKEEGSVLLGGSSGILANLPKEVYQGQSTFEDTVFPPDFHFEIHDPVLKRSISHSYEISALEPPGSLSL